MLNGLSVIPFYVLDSGEDGQNNARYFYEFSFLYGFVSLSIFLADKPKLYTSGLLRKFPRDSK